MQVIAFVEGSFEGARLREKQNAKMRFEIPQQEDKTLGAMFGFIEVRNTSSTAQSTVCSDAFKRASNKKWVLSSFRRQA